MQTRRSFLLAICSAPLAPAALLSLEACGYRPLRSVVAGAPRIAVDRAEALVAGGRGVDLASEAAFGARSELARLGALGDGASADGHEALDRLGVVIVRADERSEGVAPELGSGVSSPAGAMPIARGVRVRVLARGLVRGERGAWETPDLDASDVVATASSSPGWSAARDEAFRELARLVGAKVARAVLGLP
jgi:hypothetical protein